MMVRHRAQNVSAKPRTGDIQISEDTDFQSMLLPQAILEGLKKSGYIKPSPIQKKALPYVRCGLDLIVQAKAGTGKTCVFTVAVLETVKPNLAHLQAIILAPTREIALQITSVINAIGQCIEGLKTDCFIGGYPLSVDVEKVKGCHVAVAAPGRMKHLLEKGLLNPSHVRLFVLDEADKLMEKVFVKDVNAIFTLLPESKQVLACSATYTDELVQFLSTYMNGAQYVSPQQTVGHTVLLGVRQFVSVIPRHVDRLAQLKLKEKHLLYLLRSISFNQCLVFSNLHSRAVSLCSLLRTQGWGVEWIAGRQDQQDRVAALTQLRDQRVRVLVTTDLTARGIDVENVNLVINLDLPYDHHTYLHRMGRAGRYGSHGIVITVVSEGQELTAFQKLIGKVGGTTQAVNQVPQTLKNIDLWTMSDEKFEQICGIAKKMKTKCTPEISGKSSTSSAEKCSPESSDSEDHDEEYKTENGVREEISGTDDSSKDEKYSSESSDSEDYVKEHRGDNVVEKTSGAGNCSGMAYVTSGGNLVADGGSFLKSGKTTSVKSAHSTSADEKLSRDSSDSEVSVDKCKEKNSVTSECTCVCNLYEADASDIKVIAGPSLFAIKKEEYWREVLPVVVSESKVPLNTPIALVGSKFIRVRFWDRTQRSNKDINVESPNKEIIHFDTKSEAKEFLSFENIVSFLENEVRTEDPLKGCENTEKEVLSFESIEKALESGFCEMDDSIRVRTNEIKQVLMKYNQIKEKTECSLISFDSFDLVGWLAVDDSHNIIEDINIDKCDVFEFHLLTCLAGKNHIEVLSPPKGASKEEHRCLDHITTFNLERFHLTAPFSLTYIAQQITQLTISPDKLFLNTDTCVKLDKNSETKQALKEKHNSDMRCTTKNQNGKCFTKCTSRKEKCVPVDGRKDCDSIINNSAATSLASNSNDKSKHSCTGSSINSNTKRKKERKVVHTSSNTSFTRQTSKCLMKTENDSEYVSLNNLQKYRKSSESETSDTSDSGSYVDMTQTLAKNVRGLVNAEFGLSAQSKYPGKNKHNKGVENTRKHRNSDDSYDSCDTVEYETTDLDKKRYNKFSNESETKHQSHQNKHKDSTIDSLKESYDSHDDQNHKLRKQKVLHNKQERGKPHDSKNVNCLRESQDTYSSIESEETNQLDHKLHHKAQLKRDQKLKNKYRHEVKHKTINDDTQDSYKKLYDNSNDSGMFKVNQKLPKKDKSRMKQHSEFRYKKVEESEDDDGSVESGGTNRHSFRTACSQHEGEEHDHLHDYDYTNRSSRSSNCIYENSYEMPSQRYPSQSGAAEYSSRNHLTHRREMEREENLPEDQEFSQNVFSHYPYGVTDFESNQNCQHQYQGFSSLIQGRSTQTLTSENLHEYWYSHWYLQVRQRAMQLAMMEYINTMSMP